MNKNLPVFYSFMSQSIKNSEEKPTIIEVDILPIYQTKGVITSIPDKPISKLIK